MRSPLAIVATMFLVACAGRERVSYPNAPVILISIDTLRSDHLPAYGYGAVETPHINAFRTNAILYRHAYSPSPMTLPSHASMLTGLLPADHGVRNNIGYRLDAARSASLPCLLKRSGYATGAAVSSYVLRSESGMDGCFDEYEDAIDPAPGSDFEDYQRSGEQTLEMARRWIDGAANRPVFFLFHIYEPHVPYAPPEPYLSRYASPYDGEIAYADTIVGSFLDYLRKKEIYDRAIIILTSDHGEGLGDHGEGQHSILLYREAIQVPLLLKLPGGERRGETIDEPAQLTDLFPTIVSLLELDAPQRDGISLLALDRAGERPLFSETLYPRIHLGWSDLTSIVSGSFHYIHGPKPELYDLKSDPGEKRNLIAMDRRRAAALRKELERFLRPISPVGDVDPETAKRLAALGYVGSVRSSQQGNLPNPVDNIQQLEALRSGLMLAERGQHREAEKQLNALLSRNPAMVEAWVKLAEIHSAAGNYDAASEAFRQAISRSPVVSGDLLIQAGYALLKRERLDEAEAHAQQALDEVPTKGHELLARIELARGNVTRAEEQARAALDPRSPQPSTLVTLAEVIQKKGDLRSTLDLLNQAERRARELGIEKVYALEYLRGDTWARLGDRRRAAEAHGKEIAAFPRHLEAYAALAVIRFIEGDRVGVDRTLEQMVERNPSQRAYLLAIKTMTAFEDVRAAARWRARCSAAGFDCQG